MNQFESEYQKSGTKSASFKKIEDEYSAMKASLLSSMDMEDSSEEESYPHHNKQQNHNFEIAPQQLTNPSDKTPLKVSMSGSPNIFPSYVKHSSSRIDELSNSHGKNNQLVLESELKLGSSKADNVTHEDVLVRKLSSASGNSTVFIKGRAKNVSFVGDHYLLISEFSTTKNRVQRI